jgi:hypothetical protein
VAWLPADAENCGDGPRRAQRCDHAPCRGVHRRAGRGRRGRRRLHDRGYRDGVRQRAGRRVEPAGQAAAGPPQAERRCVRWWSGTWAAGAGTQRRRGTTSR